MALIPEQILDDIQARADIVDVISRYVPLKRAGRHYKAVCPFHKERTPSFHVNTDKQIFHCFGCGVGGNVFSFLMQQERLTFPEAVRQVAEQVGVPVPDQGDASRSGERDRLLEILAKASQYYERMLASPSTGRPARDYLRTRGVAERTRETFHLGYAPSGGDHLLQAAKRSRIPQELLEQTGLILRGKRGLVDRFRGRLLFPIQDPRGRVLGFGGRSLAGQDPKYLNSPETSVYSKGRQLFGLLQAKDAIVKAKLAIVVEGYFDCALLWQAGFPQTVSPLGTAFTPDQARLLARYTDRVVLAFDADAAGEAAALRGLDVLVEQGMQVTVAQLPAGVDPDEFVQAHGAPALQGLIDRSLGLIEFLTACAAKRYNLRHPDDKVRAAQSVLATIARVPNAMLRAEYVRLLADRLNVNAQAMAQELEKVRLHASSPPPRGPAAPPRAGSSTNGTAAAAPVQRRTGGQSAEQLFTALVLDQPARWDTLQGEIVLEDITDRRYRRILDVICELRAQGRAQPTPAQVISRLRDDEAGALVSDLVGVAQAEPGQDEALRKCVQRLRRDALQRQREQVREQIRVAQELGSEDEYKRLLIMTTTIDKQYQQLVKNTVPAGKEG